MKIFTGALILYFCLYSWSWARPQPQVWTVETQRIIKDQIFNDLKMRSKRLNCEIEDVKIDFSEVHTKSSGEREAEYQVNFKERCQKNLSTKLVVKKKVVFNKENRILRFTPLVQELHFEE